MTFARHLVALMQSHLEGDDEQFLTIAMQAAASEARQGHGKLAQQLRELVDETRVRRGAVARPREPVPLAQPRGDLASLIAARYSETRLSSMVLSPALEQRLRRVLVEQRQQTRLRSHGLRPRRKLLLLGPPGAGKTMTAAALAGKLHMPLFTIVLYGLMTKFMGETAAKLRLVFDAIAETRGVYFFDEFDAIGIANAINTLPAGLKGDREAVAETIENNVRSKIIKEHLSDPAYFEAMSALLDEIIKARKAKAIEYEEYLQKIAALAKRVDAGQADETPKTLDTPGKRALFNNIGHDEALALRIDETVRRSRHDSWRGVQAREQVIKTGLYGVLQDVDEVERIFLIDKAQMEY